MPKADTKIIQGTRVCAGVCPGVLKHLDDSQMTAHVRYAQGGQLCGYGMGAVCACILGSCIFIYIAGVTLNAWKEKQHDCLHVLS